MCHNETSTGVLNPGKEIAEIVNKYDGYLMVDCITSAGGDYVKMDDWGWCSVVSGSQKCFGVPPGLAFVGYSDKIWNLLDEKGLSDGYYMSMKKIKSAVKKKTYSGHLGGY